MTQATQLSDLAFRRQAEESAPRAFLYHVPYQPGTLEPSDCEQLKQLVRLVVETFEQQGIRATHCVEVERISAVPWRGIIQRHARHWRISTGLSLRPKGALPEPVTMANILKAKAPEPLYVTYCIQQDEYIAERFPEEEIPDPTDLFLGSGGCSVYMASAADDFLPRTRAVFAPGIHEAYSNFDFFLPKYSLNDWTSATDDDIAKWFGEFGAYIGEVEDEPGLLVASSGPLDSIQEAMQRILVERLP